MPQLRVRAIDLNYYQEIRELKPGKTLQKDIAENEKVINEQMATLFLSDEALILQFYEDMEKISNDKVTHLPFYKVKDSGIFKIIVDAPDLQQTYYVHPPILVLVSILL